MALLMTTGHLIKMKIRTYIQNDLTLPLRSYKVRDILMQSGKTHRLRDAIAECTKLAIT